MKAFQAAVGGPVVLGKLEPKEDDRTLQLVNYADVKKLLPKAPSATRFSRAVVKNGGNVPMYRNDSLPDCTCAAVGHAEITFAANNGGNGDRPDEKSVLELFDATGSRNKGRYALDILNRWRSDGFAVNEEGERERILAYVQVDPKDREAVEVALWLFGGLYAGFNLPESAQQQTRWSVVAGETSAPGSWGGHAVWLPDFTKMRGPVAWTWGEKVEMTWGFFRKYCDELYAVLKPEWFDGSKKPPRGVDLKKLTTDIESLA